MHGKQLDKANAVEHAQWPFIGNQNLSFSYVRGEISWCT
jgi:hypothetical protein